jgi:hypothetical protein
MRVFRRICGLIAAYAVALQPLLVVTLTAATVRSSAGFEICAPAADQPAAPGEHRDLQCCLVMGCGSAPALDPGEVAVRTPLPVAGQPITATLINDIRAGWPNERPPPARGPPA